MTLIQKRQRKNPHAVALGRAGGRNSRKYMTTEHASELGRRSVEVREYQRLARRLPILRRKLHQYQRLNASGVLSSAIAVLR